VFKLNLIIIEGAKRERRLYFFSDDSK